MEDIDPEIKAMSEVAKALTGLSDEGARVRVIKWASEKFGVSGAAKNQELEASDSHEAEDSTGGKPDFKNFVDLFDQVNPKSDVDKALTGGYWFQEINGKDSWTSYQVNDVLKDIGKGIGNVTRALENAQKKDPALVRQITKSGKSRQARKTYKLTTSGISLIKKCVEAADNPPSG